MGPIRSKIGEIRTKIGPFWVLSFMKIPLVSPSLDQKEQNCFGHPQFYSSIAPMHMTHGYVISLFLVSLTLRESGLTSKCAVLFLDRIFF